MNIDKEQIFTVSPDVLFQDVNGEIVLLDMASENYFGLDEVGAKIWQMLHGGNSFGDVVDALLVEYDVEPRTLESDVSELLSKLTAAGLISI